MTSRPYPPNPTLRGLVLLALKRQHPIYQYVAEQNGVAVIGYHEHYMFHHMMGLVEYDSNGAAVRMVL
ncbi:hypothetical protein SAMN05216167_108206 [Spirosoma endophyticum]|uniref:Uncharacterized protein n=1 Tax=Spirosoma endophyticum TaxID=662367 RepID=A0A1I1WCZ0_9BACT|nr:hypothetical protein SAMN05216167_108206 [Spirosoma endophyticum]